MKKKTMRALFAFLFVLGLVAGLLVPLDYKTIKKKISGEGLKPDIIDVSKRLGQLDQQTDYFKYSVLAQTDIGAVEILRLDDKIPLHKHPKETHYVYVYKGRAKGTIGGVTSEIGQGQLVVIPAGAPHSFERIGDSPVELIAFSSPPFMPNDTVWLDKK